ncbi:MAG: hypothetical protein KDA65_09780 [Planctomycetaceae bacterium]|nr:hypothetical protein [Planctomycetaceae bacterium]
MNVQSSNDPRLSHEYRFRPLRLWVWLFVGFNVAMILAVVSTQLFFFNGFDELFKSQEPPPPSWVLSVISVVLLVHALAIATHVMHAIWLWRAGENLKAFDHKKRKTLDVVVIISCFVPGFYGILMVYYLPVLYRASRPGGEKPDEPFFPPFVSRRLLIMLISFVLYMIAHFTLMGYFLFEAVSKVDRETPLSSIFSTEYLVISYLVYLVFVLSFGWPWISLLLEITRLQEEREELDTPASPNFVDETKTESEDEK